jgi:predicted phosphodiesterase
MKISLVSDLHLDFASVQLPGGEVLILAGDICEYRSFKKELPSVVNFFKNECPKYEQVFMVMGNHEHYRYRLDKTYESLVELLPANVRLLENETVDYRGVVFMGATLWTDLDRNSPIATIALKHGMNDYRAIENYYSDTGFYHKLTPEYTYRLHNNTLDYFRASLAEYQSRPVVVITHHAPSYQSIHERYLGDGMNAGYASNLDEFILDHPQIKYWLHGHTHTAFDYQVGSTRVLCNPRGYYPHEPDTGFNPDLTFEVS